MNAIERFNACEYLLDRHVAAGRGGRLAITGTAGELTYAELLERVQRTATVLRTLGLQPEQRVLMFMCDGPDFVAVYLAAIRIGAIPVPVSTMLRADGLNELIKDSRARLLCVTADFAVVASQALAGANELTDILVAAGASLPGVALPVHDLSAMVSQAPPTEMIYTTTEDSPAFWLYTSGTTGKSKGAMHRHGSVRVVCESYGQQVLGITPDDRCLSAAKAFFAYGLGNSLLFPLAVGACAILEPTPSKPDVIVDRLQTYGATLFFAGPTFFANMLRADLPGNSLGTVRMAASAGESLPAQLYQRWTRHFGVEILDGIGMTETLHIFLSNRPGDVRPGTTGKAVPGYDLRIVDDDGMDVPIKTPGTLLVRGDSAATGYWSSYAPSRQVFQGHWLRTGDTYIQDQDGYYVCLGRTGDMLKVSGMWVTPSEIESRLLAHEAISQAVVVSACDADGLEKPVAFVTPTAADATTEDELIAWCREGLPSFERPRRIIFVDAFPTTSTGKIRRVELRATAAEVLVPTQPGVAASRS